MGANQSLDHESNISINSNIDNILSMLPTDIVQTEGNNYDEDDDEDDDPSNTNADKTLKTITDNVENALKLYLLYDNYSVKTNVINNDLKNKYSLQSKDLKNKIEERDKLYNTILNNKDILIKNKKINTYLLVFIILFLIAILILGYLFYKKYYSSV